MAWNVELTADSMEDLERIDGSVRPVVLKALRKVAQNPLPEHEGGYGKSLGKRGHLDLVGLYKIKLLRQGIRIVYGLKRQASTMTIVIIALRAANQVYDMAAERRKLMGGLDN
jgi:mRNA interferase RelE/StbE